jgi:hypothetical protein
MRPDNKHPNKYLLKALPYKGVTRAGQLPSLLVLEVLLLFLYLNSTCILSLVKLKIDYYTFYIIRAVSQPYKALSVLLYIFY